MKLVVILIIVGCLQVSARVLAQKVTLNEKDAPLEKIFDDIKKQTGYNFFYEHNILNGTSKVTINVKDANLADVLNLCFANQPLEYTIAGNTVGVKKKDTEITVQAKPLPPKDITGQVVDKNGVPLAGASVLIKRTKTGTITDAKGNFELHGVLTDDILTVSYIGYKTLEQNVGDKTEFRFVLPEATNALDQVVVQAYGQTTQRLATGDIATVSAKEIERQPVMNPLEALYGKVPGLVVTQQNGYASAPISLQLRGLPNINTFLPSDPLIIIDGVPTALNGTGAGDGSGMIIATADGANIQGPANGQSPLFTLNPADIESITVLKDADATAIYGSRGANGVVIINTKKGAPGKTKLDINTYEGLSFVTGHYDLLNSEQYEAMRLEAFRNDGIKPTTGNAYDILVWDPKRYTDFQKFFWGGTGKATDIQTGVSGGDKQTNFRISGGYHRETPFNTYSGADQRGSVQFNINHKSQNQRLSISLTGQYGFTQSNLIGLGSSVTQAPDAPAIYDANGNLNFNGWRPAHLPYGSLLAPYQSKTGSLNSGLNISYEIARGFSAKIQSSFAASSLDNYQLTPIVSQDPAENPKGTSNIQSTGSRTTSIEPQLEYQKNIGKGKFDVLVGTSIQSNLSTTIFGAASGYTNDDLLHSVGAGATYYSSNGQVEYKYNAVFGRLNYNWQDKYIINLTARRDGSSRFGPGRQFGNFGAVGAAWIFTEENWVKNNLPFLSFGKLRGSYGLTGNDQIGNFEYLTQWSGVSYLPYNGVPTFVSIQHANPLLHWETDRKLELALSLGFFKDRLTFEVAGYRNRVGDQLIGYTLPEITGFNSVTANFPATVQNSGIEVTASAKLVEKKDFAWSFNMNFGRNWNVLLAFPGLAQSPYASHLVVGQPLNFVYVLHYTGVDPQTGQYTFLDKNKDGIIESDYNHGVNDLFIKDLSIKLDGGFGTDLRFKSFLLNLFFNFRVQEVASARFSDVAGNINANQAIQVLNHWQNPGDIAPYARYTTGSYSSDQLFNGRSDGRYSDGSYLRLKNVSLSYDLPGKFLKSIGFQKCQVYLRAQNLFILTKYDGLDPDTPGLGALPPMKTITAGLQMTF